MTWRNLAYDLYWQMEKIIAPGLIFSQAAYEDVLKQNLKKESLWLDLGCGHNILPFWRRQEETALVKVPKLIVGLDADLPSLLEHRNIDYKVKGDIKKLPFKDGTFNVITANMVFEHLKEPKAQLREICRVLKPGGQLIFHTPNAGGYATLLARLTPEFFKKKLIYFFQKRKAEDVFPAYYRINSSKKIKTLASQTGFTVKDISLIPSTALFIMVPPLVWLELFWIRLTMFDRFKLLRTNIIAHLMKRGHYV